MTMFCLLIVLGHENRHEVLFFLFKLETGDAPFASLTRITTFFFFFFSCTSERSQNNSGRNVTTVDYNYPNLNDRIMSEKALQTVII